MDPSTTKAFLHEHWQFLLVQLVSVTALTASIFKYASSRKDSLSWKKTEFLFKHAAEFDEDPIFQELYSVLDEKHEMYEFKDLIPNDEDPAKAKDLAHAFDRLVNFLDRIYYAVHSAQTISIKEAEIFAWHVEAVCQPKVLREYCDYNGYGKVVLLAKELNAELSFE